MSLRTRINRNERYGDVGAIFGENGVVQHPALLRGGHLRLALQSSIAKYAFQNCAHPRIDI